MIVDVSYKDGTAHKFISISSCGVLDGHQDQLYMLAIGRGTFSEKFIPLANINSYMVRKAGSE